MRFSLGKAKWYTQLIIAYALMTIIPLLTFGYFLTAYLIPNFVTHENLIIVIVCNLVLSFTGFSVLAKTVKTLARFRGYIENVAKGDLSKQILLRDGPEVTSITQSIGTIVETLKQDRARLETFSRNLEKEVAKRTEELHRDIEERKKTEQALRESNMMLSDALSELKEMQHRLLQEERMSALGQMASSVAHDFNNALMPIVGLTEFLLMNRDMLNDKEELLSTLEDIHTSADHAKQAIVRLREFYNTDKNPDLRVVDVNEVLEKTIIACMIDMQKARGANKAIDVRREFGEVPFVNADEGELREALRNVIINSIEAMADGGLLTFRSYFENKWVVMEVIDTGIGMSPDVSARCLEPFFSTKGDHGTGIGLSVVHGIIRRHKGNLVVHSEPEKGTSVKILLPVVRVAGGRTATSSGGTGELGPLRLLVVDDDISSRKLLSRYLVAAGHTVETAETGAEGIAMFERDRFDLVITDRAMPDMSGDVVAASIGESGKMVPVIMLTGFGEIMKDKGEVPKGVAMVLSKPISLKELKDAISEVVMGARAASQAGQ
ncbi:MAG: response regulator [Kiritimatiellae bacterium]|nr:response regulator [Kiritimatiellia bacterium]MDD5521499.1 response regulator [Kiritimatiellia bacterium]